MEEGQAGGGGRGVQMLQGLSQSASSVPGGSPCGSFYLGPLGWDGALNGAGLALARGVLQMMSAVSSVWRQSRSLQVGRL